MTFETELSPNMSLDMGAGESGRYVYMIQRSDYEFALVLSLVLI